MALRLLVDEDSQSKTLVDMLRKAGHDVVTAADVEMNAADDRSILAFAKDAGRALLTRNAADFCKLHASGQEHCGVFAVYQDTVPAKNVSYADIVGALKAVEASGLDPVGQFVALNAWRGR